MNHYRAFTLLLISAAFAIAPYAVMAAAGDFTGPIVPEAAQACPAGWASLIQVINNIVQFAIYGGIIICVLIFAYAGFLLVTNAAVPENRAKAKGMFINAAIGLILVLASWLIVNTVLGILGAGDVGSLTSSLMTGGDTCITAKTTPSLFSGSDSLGVTHPSTGGGGGGVASGGYTYDSAAVLAEMGVASGKLSSLLSCMRGQLPSGVGRISAVTDTYSGTDKTKIAQCDAAGSQGNKSCAHTKYSCHYGGACAGYSYAVDFGDEENKAAIRAAAKACDSSARWKDEGNHVHISVGAESGCKCDESMGAV